MLEQGGRLLLQDDRHGHSGGAARRACRKRKPGRKYALAISDFAAGGSDRIQVGVGNVVAVAETVAAQEGGDLTAFRGLLWRDQSADAVAAFEIGPPMPQMRATAAWIWPRDLRYGQRSRSAVEAQAGVVVVDDIDAADEGDTSMTASLRCSGAGGASEVKRASSGR